MRLLLLPRWISEGEASDGEGAEETEEVEIEVEVEEAAESGFGQ